MSDSDCMISGDPISLEQDGEFVVEVRVPPNDDRCVAGWGLLNHGRPDSARCGNKATMPDLPCFKCHLEFRPRKT